MSDSSQYAKVYWPMFWSTDTFSHVARWSETQGGARVLGSRDPLLNFDWNNANRVAQIIEAAVDQVNETTAGNGPAWNVFIPEAGLEIIGSRDRTFLDKEILQPIKSSEFSNISKMVGAWFQDDPEASPRLILPACFLRDLIIAQRHQAQLALPKHYFENAVKVLQHESETAAAEGKRDLMQRLNLVKALLTDCYTWQGVSTFTTNGKKFAFDKLTTVMKEYELEQASRIRGRLSFANFQKEAFELEGWVKKAIAKPQVSAFLGIAENAQVGLPVPKAVSVAITRGISALLGSKQKSFPMLVDQQLPFEMFLAFASMPVIPDPMMTPLFLYTLSWESVSDTYLPQLPDYLPRMPPRAVSAMMAGLLAAYRGSPIAEQLGLKPAPAAPGPAPSPSQVPGAPAAPTSQITPPTPGLFCRNCGADLPSGSKFCTRCGTPVIV